MLQSHQQLTQLLIAAPSTNEDSSGDDWHSPLHLPLLPHTSSTHTSATAELTEDTWDLTRWCLQLTLCTLGLALWSYIGYRYWQTHYCHSTTTTHQAPPASPTRPLLESSATTRESSMDASSAASPTTPQQLVIVASSPHTPVKDEAANSRTSLEMSPATTNQATNVVDVESSLPAYSDSSLVGELRYTIRSKKLKKRKLRSRPEQHVEPSLPNVPTPAATAMCKAAVSPVPVNSPWPFHCDIPREIGYDDTRSNVESSSHTTVNTSESPTASVAREPSQIVDGTELEPSSPLSPLACVDVLMDPSVDLAAQLLPLRKALGTRNVNVTTLTNSKLEDEDDIVGKILEEKEEISEISTATIVNLDNETIAEQLEMNSMESKNENSSENSIQNENQVDNNNRSSQSAANMPAEDGHAEQ